MLAPFSSNSLTISPYPFLVAYKSAVLCRVSWASMAPFLSSSSAIAFLPSLAAFERAALYKVAAWCLSLIGTPRAPRPGQGREGRGGRPRSCRRQRFLSRAGQVRAVCVVPYRRGSAVSSRLVDGDFELWPELGLEHGRERYCTKFFFFSPFFFFFPLFFTYFLLSVDYLGRRCRLVRNRLFLSPPLPRLVAQYDYRVGDAGGQVVVLGRAVRRPPTSRPNPIKGRP